MKVYFFFRFIPKGPPRQTNQLNHPSTLNATELAPQYSQIIRRPVQSSSEQTNVPTASPSTSSNFRTPNRSSTSRKIPKNIMSGSKFRNSYHSSSQESNSHSDHSGGSGATLKMDDIDFADA